MKSKFYIIHLALHRGYFEAVLIENTQRTLGVKKLTKKTKTVTRLQKLSLPRNSNVFTVVQFTKIPS
jgi:hypothetical protein